MDFLTLPEERLSTPHQRKNSFLQRAHYTPPWANTSIIGIAGSSGSGKTSLALTIVAQLNLPWVIILSMDSYYKPLTPDQSQLAFRNEYDFDSPEAIDFDALVKNLKELKAGKKADIPIYSFEKHARVEKTNTIYSPHVLILEGIFALHDDRVLDMLDLKVFAEADADVCLSRRLLRDVKHRGRDIEGCMKQWFTYVKPNFHKYVEPQRNVADIIIPRGIENKVAISMISDRIRKILSHKSTAHTLELKRLGQWAETQPLSTHCITLEQTAQIRGIHTLLLNRLTDREEFIFMLDRLSTLLISRATSLQPYAPTQIVTPVNVPYMGLAPTGQITAVVLERGGCCLEPALLTIVPNCRTGRLLIQHSPRTGEPELHYLSLPPSIAASSIVLLLDAQMSSGGAGLMAVRVLVDHGVAEERIVFCAIVAGRRGVGKLLSVFPDVRIVVASPFVVAESSGGAQEEGEDRWIERKYLGC